MSQEQSLEDLKKIIAENIEFVRNHYTKGKDGKILNKKDYAVYHGTSKASYSKFTSPSYPEDLPKIKLLHEIASDIHWPASYMFLSSQDRKALESLTDITYSSVLNLMITLCDMGVIDIVHTRLHPDYNEENYYEDKTVLVVNNSILLQLVETFNKIQDLDDNVKQPWINNTLASYRMPFVCEEDNIEVINEIKEILMSEKLLPAKASDILQTQKALEIFFKQKRSDEEQRIYLEAEDRANHNKQELNFEAEESCIDDSYTNEMPFS